MLTFLFWSIFHQVLLIVSEVSVAEKSFSRHASSSIFAGKSDCQSDVVEHANVCLNHSPFLQYESTKIQRCFINNRPRIRPAVVEKRADHYSTMSLALVPYDESKIGQFHKAVRKFTFRNGALKVSIKQNWQDVGVAAVVWDAAVVLGEYLADNTELIRNKRVIELGAGTGLSGIVTAALGAAEVTLTDRPVALDMILHNININKHLFKSSLDSHKQSSHQTTCSSSLNLQKAEVDCSRSIKFNSVDENFDVNEKPNIPFVRELVWGEKETLLGYQLKGFDVIIGADIVYIEETFDALIETLKYLSEGVENKYGDKGTGSTVAVDNTVNRSAINDRTGSNNAVTSVSDNNVSGVNTHSTHSKSTSDHFTVNPVNDSLIHGHTVNDKTLILLAAKIRYERDEEFLRRLRYWFRVEQIHYDQSRDVRIYSARLLV